MKSTNVVAQALLWLAIIGALNWGLVGLFDWDLVRAILGGSTRTDASALSRIVYALVGLAGLGLIFLAPRLRSSQTATGAPAHRAEARA